MKLREHPLLTYKGVPSWPPIWHWLGDGLNSFPKGEVGILKEIKAPFHTPFNRCFLVIEYKSALYMGSLMVDDIAFGIALGRLLRDFYGESIESIGDLNVGHTL